MTATYLQQKGHVRFVRLEARRHHMSSLQHRSHFACERWVVDIYLGEPNGTCTHCEGHREAGACGVQCVVVAVAALQMITLVRGAATDKSGSKREQSMYWVSKHVTES